MPHINRHQQRALLLRSGDTRTPETKAKFNQVREALRKQVEEREARDEVKYWERRAWLYSR